MMAVLIFVEAVVINLGVYGFWLGRKLKNEEEWEGGEKAEKAEEH
jgi:hypothetical protein